MQSGPRFMLIAGMVGGVDMIAGGNSCFATKDLLLFSDVEAANFITCVRKDFNQFSVLGF